MKASERHGAILDLVRTRDTKVEQLSAALGVSEATVRRDLTMLAKQGHLVRTYGGDLRGSSMSTLGPLAELTLSRLSVDKAFLGADGVVAEFGLCEASTQQAYLKECIIKRAAEIMVLADTDKLGRARQQHWTPIEREWRLITCATANDADLAPFRAIEHITVETVAFDDK
jgi:DeoR/GlpR family transcriptional regulator of sugar metabolism